MNAPSSSGSYGTVSVGTSVTSIVIPAHRKSVLIQNVHATNKLYVGLDSSVTTSNGLRLSPDDSVEFSTYVGAIFAIADGASTDVRYVQMGR